MTTNWCSTLPGGIRLAVQVTPNAKKTQVIGLLDDALKIKLQAQPIDGKANLALIDYLARTLAVPRSAITITHGLSSKRKLIEVVAPGLSIDAVTSLLIP